MKNNPGFGQRVKRIRQQLHMSQSEFGTLFEPPAPKSAVSRWEHGGTPTAERLKVIAKKGNVSVDYLLNGSLSEALSQIARSIDQLHSQYFDEFGNVKKTWPKRLDDLGDPQLAYSLETIGFIESDSYVARPEAWETHSGESNPQYSVVELEEIRHYYRSNFLKGLLYCGRQVHSMAKQLSIRPDQTLLLYKLFPEAAKAHFEEHTRDNHGAFIIVAHGLEDIEQSLYSLTHATNSEGQVVELDNDIDPDLYSGLQSLLESWQQKIQDIRDSYLDF